MLATLPRARMRRATVAPETRGRAAADARTRRRPAPARGVREERRCCCAAGAERGADRGPGEASPSGAGGADPGRRAALLRSLAAAPSASAAAALRPAPAAAADKRQRLLDTIGSAAPSADVLAAIDDLVTSGGGANAVAGGGIGESAESFRDLLGGRWRLLWSSDGAEVSRFTRLLPVSSYQLIGAAGGLGEGRAANLVTALGGLLVLKLSSAAVPSAERFDAVTIGPPFYFELLVGGEGGAAVPLGSETAVGSDESPLLGSQLNTFTQLYVEKGADGLRISKVTEGDRGVVGSTFVHVRV